MNCRVHIPILPIGLSFYCLLRKKMTTKYIEVLKVFRKIGLIDLNQHTLFLEMVWRIIHMILLIDLFELSHWFMYIHHQIYHLSATKIIKAIAFRQVKKKVFFESTPVHMYRTGILYLYSKERGYGTYELKTFCDFIRLYFQLTSRSSENGGSLSLLYLYHCIVLFGLHF